MVVVGFAVAIGVGTLLLLLPMARKDGSDVDWIDSVFTATSAITVTGLVTEDPGTTWTWFGQVVVLVLIQIGGLGMITTGTLLMMLVSRRLGLRTRLAAQREKPGLMLGDVKRILGFALASTVIVELVMSFLLTLTFLIRYDYPIQKAAWYGLFHSVSAFNNAGFALFPDGLIGFQDDPFVLGIIMVSIVIGGLGLPVYLDIRRYGWRRPRRWSLHSKMTVVTTAVLLLFGAVFFTIFEWSNGGTHVATTPGSGVLNGIFASVTSRTAGFNAMDYGQATEETIVLTCLLMIIGGGSASTAGGIKVTTFIILFFVLLAEARGSKDVNVGDRRLPSTVIRTALAITVSYSALLGFGIMFLLAFSDVPLTDVVFETFSATATAGLSTGITPTLGTPELVVLMLLMFTGRLGAITLASAFALRRKPDPYRYPEGSPIIG